MVDVSKIRTDWEDVSEADWQVNSARAQANRLAAEPLNALGLGVIEALSQSGGAVSFRVENGALVFTDEDAVVLIPVTPTAPTFTDQAGTANDTYTIPATTGIQYLVGGSPVTAGTYPGSGTVTVTAQATAGYELQGTSSWSHTFSALAATYAQEVMADSPAAYYPFSEASSPAVDTTGNTAQASIEGVTFGAVGLGDGATSADFTGGSATAGWATAPDADLMGITSFEALVQFDAVGSSTQRCVVGINDGLGNERAILRSSSTGRAELVAFTSGGTAVLATATAALTTGTTYHFAGVITPTGIRLYVNGTQAATASTASTWMTITSPLPVMSVGFRKGEGAFANNLDGKVAGVAAYTTELSAARILAHATAAGVV